MKAFGSVNRGILGVSLTAAVVFLLAGSIAAGGYDNALKGVTRARAVFEVTQGSPKVNNIIFWAVKNVYEDETVKGLAEPPQVVVVFHGAAVKLISTDRSGFGAEDVAEINTFQDTIRQMKKDGVTFEVCDYALKVMGVDAATVIPEIDHVGNGLISVIGYQAQGYSVVRVP